VSGEPPHFLETATGLLERGHAVRFPADGWSMHPTIRYGETIIVEPLGAYEARRGEILLYRSSRSAIAHRLVRLTSVEGDEQLVFRGDAADCCDPPIAWHQVLGRVIAVERGGREVRFGYLGRIWRPVVARALRHVRICRMKAAKVIW
jgi:hypothetical protein